MARHCTNCAAQIPQGAHFCPSCGQAVSEGEEQAPRIPAQQQREPSQQAVSPEVSPTQQASLPAEPARNNYKLIKWALAIAALLVAALLFLADLAYIVGFHQPGATGLLVGMVFAIVPVPLYVALAALVVVGGLALYFLVFARSGSSGELLSERPTPQQASGQGSLKEIVPQQVGDFTLESELKEYTGALQAGATQGVFMEYADPMGRGKTHHLAFFSSPEAADQWMRKGIDEWVDADLQEVKDVDLTDEQGQWIGTAVLLRGELFGELVEIVEWTNGDLYADAMALPGEHAVEFFNVPPPY